MKSQTRSFQQALEEKLAQAQKENVRRLGNIEHRLEFVDEVNGVEYINDAKASDINSTWYSIDCMEKPVVWIACSSEYDEADELLDEIDYGKLRAVIVMGKNSNELVQFFSERTELVGKVNTMIEAVAHATLVAERGDIVLFSPACEDFEHFKSYKDSGQQFRKAVREMRL
jgi:UDP-N-acetylmuramoylalanine--D-glutamate ligase